MLTALYIHIPFCDKICTYCDFHKEIASLSKQEKYLVSLKRELETHKNEYKDLLTVYIGGGTPSSLTLKLLEDLFHTIATLIDISSLTEFTIETNPNDITIEKAKLFKKYGINRVSIGVQTFNNNHLKFLGRTHRKEDVLKAINNLKEANITNISIDMIFSLVNQTIEELNEDIIEVTNLPIDHISYYSLILEEKTILHYLYSQNKISMNTEDLEALMYNKVIDTLNEKGFYQYEISNFCKNGHESLHNLVYWQNKQYLGLGSGSHSLYLGKRFSNIRNVRKYTEALNKGQYVLKDFYEVEPLREEMIMGLRLIKGVNITHVNNKYDIDLLDLYPEINDFITKKLLTLENDQLYFTRQGLLLGNIVFSIF